MIPVKNIVTTLSFTRQFVSAQKQTEQKWRKKMIDYSPFFQTLKDKNESTYTMIHKHNVSSSLINRLRNNKPVSTTTLNDLCRILKCNVEDILVYIESDNDQFL